MSQHSDGLFGNQDARPKQFDGIHSKSTYLKMRDGIEIAIEIYLPANLLPGQKIPALLSQTRYWRAVELRRIFKWFITPDDLNPDYREFKSFFTSRGYALVYVDVRGTGASFGNWPYPWSRASFEDAREIVDWIIRQSWSNGTLGAFGISYVGTTAELLPAINHPAVKAVIPMFNHPDAFIDVAFPGGVLNDRFLRDWGLFDRSLDNHRVPAEYGLRGRLVVRGVKPVDITDGNNALKAACKAHASNGSVYDLAKLVTYRDQHAAEIDICVDDLAVHLYHKQLMEAQVPVFGFGSWMDAGTADAVIRRFLTYRHAHRAVIGAWEHGGRFNASPYMDSNLRSDPPLRNQWIEMLNFFDVYLMGIDNGLGNEKVLHYFTMGEEKWKRTSIWPPEGIKNEIWFFAEKNSLTQSQPIEETGADTYKVDFKASTGKNNRWWEMSSITNMTVIYPDRSKETSYLLTYTSLPLESDLEVTGYPVITLYASSTHDDGTFFVYLEDVHPNGKITYITEGILRAIHRKISTSKPPYRLQVPYHSFKEVDSLPLIPGKTEEIKFGLLPTSVLIRKGHQIRISIAGHDEGTFIRYPGKGQPIIKIERNVKFPSHIELPIIRR